MRPTLHKLNAEFGAHICGEGGEFETFTLDCPLYKSKLCIDEQQVVEQQPDDFAPVAYLRLSRWHVEPKGLNVSVSGDIAAPPEVTIVTDAALRGAGVLDMGGGAKGETPQSCSGDGETGAERRGEESGRIQQFGARVAMEGEDSCDDGRWEQGGVEAEAEAVLEDIGRKLDTAGLRWADAVSARGSGFMVHGSWCRIHG